MNELALFAGAGGGILGGHLLGWKTICAVEIEDYPRRVLLQRQKDGILSMFPIWDDIKTFDGKPWRGRCDIITGGFPCQDISSAGEGAGIYGECSGLWREMAMVVCEVRPNFVFVENSPMLTLRGLNRVLGDLAALGYDARWCVLGADSCGAPHERKRIWILAYAEKMRLQKLYDKQKLSYQKNEKICRTNKCNSVNVWDLWQNKTDLFGDDNGTPRRMDRLKAIGNGQVPAVAALAFVILSEGLI